MKKRILAVLTCFALLLCGCGKGHRTGATLEVDLTHSYASEPLDMQGMRVYPVAVTEQGVIMLHGTQDNKIRAFLYNFEENTYTEIEKSETNAPACVTQLPDGRLAALYDIAQGRKNGGNAYDGKTRMLEIYDSNLHPVETKYLGEDVPEQVLSYTGIAMDADGYWYFITYDADGFYTLFILNPDLTVKGSISTDSMTCEQLVVGKSGKIYGLMTASSEQYAESRSYQLYRFDAGTMTAERLDHFEFPADARRIIGGSIYELYYYNDDGIYGINEDGTTELNVDFMNSDFPDTVWDCTALPNGEFIIEYSEGYSASYYKLRPRTEEEIENTKVISLAGVALSPTLIQDVCRYNQSQLDYRIVLKDYAMDDKDEGYPYSEAVEAFKSDLLNGIIPDVICMDGMPYQQLSNKGLLTDFAPMLEAEERFDPTLYHMNILDGMKKGEKLERIGFSFRISTAAAKTELVGEQQGRTPEEYMDMIHSMPEGISLLPDMSQESILYYYLTGCQSAFIDKDNGTCSFTSESFVQLLELAGSLQTQEELYGDTYESWQWQWLTNENALLHVFDIEKPITYHDTHSSTFFMNEDITLVGFPDASGGNGGKYTMNYTIALTSRSDKVEPVWEFIMGELSSLNQSKKCLDTWDYESNSLPVMRDSLDYCLLAATLGANRSNGNASEEEMEVLGAYIEGLKMYADDDPFITDVIKEEAEMYFAGDQTADRAAEMIQSRISLYLSEQT